MRQIIFAFFICLFLSSCTNTVILNYDDTNPVKIEEANEGLDLSLILPGDVNGTIAVRSIEEYVNENLDAGVVYSIEDNLVANLVENGYRVVERDPDALDNLYKEETDKYQKSDVSDTRDPLIETLDLDILTPDSYLLVDGESADVPDAGCCDANSNVFDYLIDEHKSISESSEEKLVSTGLSAADYILSYRVLECGVNYFEIDPKEKKFRDSSPVTQYERSARTRLHCRLTSTKTSEILAAGLVENEVIDIVDKDDVKSLQQMSYKYYHHTLPNQSLGSYRESSGYAKANEMIKAEKSSKKKSKRNKTSSGIGGLDQKWLYGAGALFFVMMIND